MGRWVSGSLGGDYKPPTNRTRLDTVSPLMAISMIAGSVCRFVLFPIQHKYIRRTQLVCVHINCKSLTRNYYPSWALIEVEGLPVALEEFRHQRTDVHAPYNIAHLAQYCK